MNKIIPRRSKLTLRRFVRRHSQAATDATDILVDKLDKNLLRRFARVLAVQRFLIGWTLLIVLTLVGLVVQWTKLDAYYLENRPVHGGQYTEGVVGTFTNSNPMFAQSMTDATVSKLLFSGLLSRDVNNKLVMDLAESYSTDDRAQIYNVKLKKNLKWHDGVALTSADVVYTFQTIQNIETRSPLRSSWVGVEVVAIDELSVSFKLPNPLASFAESLTQGIVPKHRLNTGNLTNLRSLDFNTEQVVGNGPYIWRGLQTSGSGRADLVQTITLKSNPNYHFGQPLIERMIIKTYPETLEISTSKAFAATETKNLLLDALKSGEVDATPSLDSVPVGYDLGDKFQFLELTESSAVYAYFKTDSDLLKDLKLRRALTQAVDTKSAVSKLSTQKVLVDEPLLNSSMGYAKEYAQSKYDVIAAKKSLDDSGWVLDATLGYRIKAGKMLEFNLVTEQNEDYQTVARDLVQQWKNAGVKVNINVQSSSTIGSTTIKDRSYDILLYGVAIGTDPDVFAYWHSSQFDSRSLSRLNLSNWKNVVADASLEAGRTRVDAQLRSLKYKPFLQAWKDEAPAIGLYQPTLVYLVSKKVSNMSQKRINTPSDRFNDVHKWSVVEQKARKINPR
jgi:peptide/nickel transport system substrate-binding protein